MTQEELIDWFGRHGYERDPYGNYKKRRESGIRVRYKMNKNSVRYERRVESDKPFWARIASGYYKKLSLTDDDKLKGMKR